MRIFVPGKEASVGRKVERQLRGDLGQLLTRPARLRSESAVEQHSSDQSDGGQGDQPDPDAPKTMSRSDWFMNQLATGVPLRPRTPPPRG